ncbi:MAG: GIY-YIG nuclease family protein [Candidatus Omnitrophota bacterium]|nr:GIY-YIG nuclease family protein [Candidatus Omnitrophota bacterium]
MWYLYIIKCDDTTLYTGITTDLKRRIKKHNDKKGGHYTRVRLPVELVYHESCPTCSHALKRELEIKSWTKKKKERLIKSISPIAFKKIKT